MTQEVKYKGYTAQPSDYESTDGELSLSLGLIQEDGALKPIMPPSVEMMPTEKIIYIHEVQGEKNYITSGDDLGWIKGSDESYHDFTHSFSGVEVYQVTSIGNTLIVLASDGMHYFLWKYGDYKYIGQKMPECQLSFGLNGTVERKKKGFEFSNWEAIWHNEGTLTERQKQLVSDLLMGGLASFIKERSIDEGKFVFPFFLRYAYRLYDGSLVYHSSPIYIPALQNTPSICFSTSATSADEQYAYMSYVINIVTHSLVYKVINETESFSDWSDIIKSVDIFISKPIYTYDQNGDIEKVYKYKKEKDGVCVCKHINRNKTSINAFPNAYQSHYVAEMIDASGETCNSYFFDVPSRDKLDIERDIKSCSLFYRLCQIPIAELSKKYTEIKISKEYLQALTSREVMTDDYDSHDILIPQYSFVYNSRLNICNLKKKNANVSNLVGFVHTDGFVELYSSYTADSYTITYTVAPFSHNKGTLHSIKIYVEIKNDSGNIIVKVLDYESGDDIYKIPLYIYYYNRGAISAYIDIDGNKLYCVPLLNHELLSGSFFYGKISEQYLQEEYRTITEVQVILDIQNKIYTSEVNNPFLFPITGINTIGLGKVNAICAATKALSEGQFGQFPLYAFTSDGVWALEVSNTGTYSSKQPITREVCTNVDSITQIDTAVLFATNRGIMLLSGSTCVCISDSINNLKPFTLSRLPSSAAIIDTFNSKVNRMDELRDTDVEMLPFLDFIKDDCRMVYDYTNQHIVVYKPDYYYAYVYSMKSKQWGMMRCDFESNVNSYPESLVMGYVKRLRQVRPGVSHTIRIRALLNLSIADSGYIRDEDGYLIQPFGALLVTRPFDFEQPDVFKTIDTIIQRGNFPRDKVQQVLYGSNDLQHWFPIWSSVDKYMRGFRGTPYKAFRLAVIAQLEQHEDIDGFSVQFTPRLTNQLR